jgi:hypothetical protein
MMHQSGCSRLMGVTMKQLLVAVMAIGALLVSSPSRAMNYSPPGPYELSVGGSYAEQNNAEGEGGPGGCSANLCGYIPADFSSSNQFSGAGNGTIYDFTFTVSSGATDYLNVSEASGTEQFIVTSYTCGSNGVSGCGSSPSWGTLFSGPTTIDDPSGLSFAFSAGGSAVSYLVQLQLNNGDDPTNYISLTSATPLPTALPLLTTGLGFLGFLSRRKKQKTSAEIATA